MLSLLHIENIAVIESADIQFDKGFNALTGETGAGKSIVVDAIGAIIGERTSRDLIRTGARSALVNAVFTGLPPLAWFPGERRRAGRGWKSADPAGDPAGRQECVPPEWTADHRSSATATGPAAPQYPRAARRPAAPGRAVPPGVSGWIRRNGSLQEEYRAAFGRFAVLRREIAALQMDEAEKARRIDSLEFQIAELERAGLKAGEEGSLTERRNLLQQCRQAD